MLDVVAATDDQGNGCSIHSKHVPHVTIICLETKQAKLKAEVTRFITAVKPYLPEMIRDATNIHAGSPAPLVFTNATYTTNLFNLGIKGYLPDPIAHATLIHLNEKLTEFVHGTYIATSPGNHQTLGKFDLKVRASNKPIHGAVYTPHLTVKAPSTYAGSDLPVLTLTATLNPTFTVGYYLCRPLSPRPAANN